MSLRVIQFMCQNMSLVALLLKTLQIKFMTSFFGELLRTIIWGEKLHTLLLTCSRSKVAKKCFTVDLILKNMDLNYTLATIYVSKR